MQAEELCDPDFQPNKRARFAVIAERSSQANVQNHSITGRISVGLGKSGKENLLPVLHAAPDNTLPHCLLTACADDTSDVLPVRKAKFSMQSATATLPELSPACQPAPPLRAVRAFFTKRPSWSATRIRSKCETALSNHNATCVRESANPVSNAGLQLSPPHAACSDTANSQAALAAHPAKSAHLNSRHLGFDHAEAICVQRQKPLTIDSLPAPTAPSRQMPPAQAESSSETLPGNFIVLDSSDSDADSDNAEFADLQTQAAASQQAVAAWLHQHGLAAYVTAFEQAEVDLDLIPWLHDNDLKQMGVTALGPRRKILAAAAQLAAASADNALAQDASVRDPSVEDASVEEASVEDAFVEEASVKNASAESNSVADNALPCKCAQQLGGRRDDADRYAAVRAGGQMHVLSQIFEQEVVQLSNCAIMECAVPAAKS